jgi:hypothetical protein
VVNQLDQDDGASPITDSPWYWVLLFSLMALLALAVIGFSGKYGKRQAVIERQYQARERVAEKITRENNSPGGARIDQQESRRPFATPGEQLIPLWPLAVLLGIVATLAATVLLRASRVARNSPWRAAPGPENNRPSP